MKRILFFIFLLNACLVPGQNPIDSLLSVLKKNKPEDSSRAYILNELAWKYSWINMDTSLWYSDQAKKLSEKLEYAHGYNVALNNKATAFFNFGKYKEALKIHEDLLSRSIVSGNQRYQMLIHNNIATDYNELGEFKKAIEHIFDALKIADKTKDNIARVGLRINSAVSYNSLKDYKRALAYTLEAENIFKASGLKDLSTLANIYTINGAILTDMKNDAGALTYLEKAKNIYLETNDLLNLPLVYTNLGVLYMNNEQKKYSLSRDCIKRALVICKEFNDTSKFISCYINLAACNKNEAEQSNIPSPVLLTNALVYLDSANRIADDAGSRSDCIVIYEIKKDIYKLLKNPDSAFAYLEKYTELNDSVFSSEKEIQIQELSTKYETEKKETENKELLQQNKIQSLTINNNRYLMAGLTSLLLIFAVVAFLFIRQNKLKAQQRSMQLEQKLLRSQMNPHFIFNSLNSIHSVVLNGDKKNAASYLASFAKLIRSILESSRFELISLEKETVLLENYIRLQILRFENEISYHITVDPLLEVEDTMLPPMLTQPFIENAIEHGLYHVKENAQLIVSFKKENDFLHIEVCDNGPGLYEQNSNEQHISMATGITRERLQLLNRNKRKKTSFSISEAFPENKERKGVKVSFYVPLT